VIFIKGVKRGGIGMARIDEMIKKLSPELQLFTCNIRQWIGVGKCEL